MRDRTADLLRAKQALSQLSYGPKTFVFLNSRLRGNDKVIFLLVAADARKFIRKCTSNLTYQFLDFFVERGIW